MVLSACRLLCGRGAVSAGAVTYGDFILRCCVGDSDLSVCAVSAQYCTGDFVVVAGMHAGLRRWRVVALSRTWQPVWRVGGRHWRICDLGRFALDLLGDSVSRRCTL